MLLSASLFLGGCEQNKVEIWEDDGRIGLYFEIPEYGTNVSDPVIYAGQMEYNNDLWKTFCGELYPNDADKAKQAQEFYSRLALKDNSGACAYYSGESDEEFVPDTVILLARYTGPMRDGFSYRLQAWPGGCSLWAKIATCFLIFKGGRVFVCRRFMGKNFYRFNIEVQSLPSAIGA